MKVSVFGSVMLASGVVALSCGCGSSGGSSAGGQPTSPATSATTTSPPASSTTTTTPSSSTTTSDQSSGAPAACPTSSLRVATAPGSGGAAGSFYFDLTFTNVGSASCTLYGYPGVSFTTASHAQLGLPAERDSAQAQLVTLSPGSVASNQVRIPDVGVYPVSACRPATAALIKVYPPNQKAAVYVATSSKVCTTSQGRSGVQTVVPGGHAGV